ncbi:FKBP-type peptidyl-prolyl cis-trans isomerase [Phycicoccus sp. CSK15P-2]|uniref:FKBP-type peptidyl-prolyl cis-trans isomerase n=1 Tax=Phycicoccus sp. CSK15P-2 TaxID=2807627 RepID=UPI0019510EA6|nr:FKBP-type peptidyl-prolyl cis-trans isomerase [Phycicoccus sp. CSK15P-2]MBM6405811.1 FKBP-type peptidyl-prolyl cis-trans isomerase [Phycicoccus sp. CSK15P-2]
MSRLSRALPAAALVGALALSACGEETASEPAAEVTGVEVTGEAGAQPEVTVEAPLEVASTSSEIVTPGDGAEVAQDDLVSVQAVLVNGTDGEVLTSTWEQGPVGLDLGDEQLFTSFRSQLPGKTVGSRVVIASTSADAFGEQGNEQLGVAKDDPVVFVVDVLGATQVLDQAQGKEVAPEKGLPTVEMKDGEPAVITMPKDAKAPEKTVVQPLIEGEGAKVEEGQTVRVAYTGALLRNGEVFDSSASRPEQPYFDFAVGQGQVIKGWDTGIAGQPVGSRLLLVIPPAEGYGDAGSGDKIKGDDTLVFVVDILAAY